MTTASKPFSTDNASEIKRLELALESAGIGTWELDPQTNQVQWCHRTKKLFYFEGDDVVDSEILFELIDPRDRDLLSQKIISAAGQVAPAGFSAELRTRANGPGEHRCLLCKGQSIPDDVTSRVRVLGTFIDITKEISNRTELNAHQQHVRSFQTIVEQAPMAFGLLKGPEFIIEQGNDKIFEIWGKDASITGMKLADALPEIKGQGFLELLEQVYHTGIPYAGTGTAAKIVRNGQLEEMYFDFVYTPIRTHTNEVTGVMVMAHEVTRQYQIRKKLEESEAKFKALIDQAPVATCLFVGKHMIVELANRPMIDYWGKDESVIGKPLREALPELVEQPFLNILDEILKTGVEYSSKNAAVNIEVAGELRTFYFNFTFKPIFDGDGNIYGIINMSIDVTAQVLALKALEESESKLRAVIASAPAAVGLFVGRDLRVELPNQAFIDIVGKGPDIIGVPLREVMPELENQPFLQILDNVYTTGVPYQSYGTQVNIVQKGVMTYNYYDITYSPVLDNEGKVYAILDIAIDVTERVNIERQIEKSQMQLLSLFEQSPVGIAMVQKEDLIFTMANPYYAKLVGRECNEIVGKPLLQALPEMKEQGFDTLLQDVITTGIPYLSKEQSLNIIHDGGLKTIYVNLAYQPHRDTEGNISGVLIVATELTDQVLSRKKMEETQAFLQGAIELAELGTYAVDIQTGILECSDRMKEWFGLEKDPQITFDKIYNAISPDDTQDVVNAVNQAIDEDTNGFYDKEFTLEGEKTGSDRILHVQGRILYDGAGKPHSIIGTAQDVTAQRKIKIALEQLVQQRTEQLKAMNEELAAINEEYISTNEELSTSNNMLQQSNVNLQQFAYVASHDLQEPLRKIRSFSDLLINRYSDRLGDGITYLQRMQAAASRMSQLIEDLLAFSRITAHNEVTTMVPLNDVVGGVLSDLELIITETSAVIRTGDLPEIQGDQMQLNQLFLNLISNALKFRKPNSRPVISITSMLVPASRLPSSLVVTRTSTLFYRIDVTDNGIGFEQQYANRIFQLFQRLHGRSQYSGTGIGLAICERVAANHGGGIAVLSEPGNGATFSIFLPL